MSNNQLFRKKSLDVMVQQAESGDGLRRSLGPVALTSLGVGAIIGTGIFVLVGKAAADLAGPSIMLSFVVAGIACVFAALCYAEFASMAPVAGSAYNYAYATMGELLAWIIGWDLILEYCVASSTVARGWSNYIRKLLEQMQINLFTPGGALHKFAGAPFDYNSSSQPMKSMVAGGEQVELAGRSFMMTGFYFDFLAVFITGIITYILVRGVRESAWTNNIMVVIKVAVIIFVIVAGFRYVQVSNWTDNFAPFGYGGIMFFGHPVLGSERGMLAGAALVIFAYLGFDAVSTQAEEAKNPKRDLPIGIIGSLIICTIFYVLVSGVLTGMVRYDQIDRDAPIATAFQQVGLPVAQFLITAGAIAGITSVLLVMMMGQPRIFLAMARDGLLPEKFFGAIHPTYRTPHLATILTGAIVASAASLLPLNILAELVSIGTLFAFSMVCMSVLVLRYTDPHRHRPFRCPFSPWFPAAGIILCVILMLSLPGENWLRLIVWFGLGLIVYFLYGYRHSHLRNAPEKAQS